MSTCSLQCSLWAEDGTEGLCGECFGTTLVYLAPEKSAAFGHGPQKPEYLYVQYSGHRWTARIERAERRAPTGLFVPPSTPLVTAGEEQRGLQRVRAVRSDQVRLGEEVPQGVDAQAPARHRGHQRSAGARALNNLFVFSL